MRATALPARIAYAVLAAPVAGLGGFYVAAQVVGRMVPWLEGVRGPEPGWGEFVGALLAGVALGFWAFCFALTLPRWRRRNRTGRRMRMAVSALLVLLIAVSVDLEGVPLAHTFALIVWLSLTLTFTVIRYGILDPPAGSATRRRPGAKPAASADEVHPAEE